MFIFVSSKIKWLVFEWHGRHLSIIINFLELANAFYALVHIQINIQNVCHQQFLIVQSIIMIGLLLSH